MEVTPEEYHAMQKKAAPASRTFSNMLKAFAVGGGICAAGQLLMTGFLSMGMDQQNASLWTSVTLIVCSAVMTGFGLYERISKHAGAGTLVPVTGFANAIASSAAEAATEGYVLGIGAKIFTIAGPVILYGNTAAVICGILFYLM